MIVETLKIIFANTQSVAIICTVAVGMGIIMTILESWKFYRGGGF